MDSSKDGGYIFFFSVPHLLSRYSTSLFLKVKIPDKILLTPPPAKLSAYPDFNKT
jgi:hypothetical protein